MMSRLYELIMKIKPCPELYIGTRDIHRLRAFLSGYCQACGEQSAESSESWLWEDFRIYLAQKYSDCRSLDWAGLIERHEPDGGSTDAFFRMLEEYIKTRRIIMFRPMRRTAQQLTRQQCLDILAAATHGVLAVHGDEGYPYAVPLSYVLHDEKIYIHCAMSGHKLDAMKMNKKVSFCVVAQDEIVPETYSTDYISVIVFGRARIMDDPAEKRAAIERLAVRYAPNEPTSHMNAEIEESAGHMAMVEITIEHMTGKQSLRMAKEQRGE